jgi:hypothetical protein
MASKVNQGFLSWLLNFTVRKYVCSIPFLIISKIVTEKCIGHRKYVSDLSTTSLRNILLSSNYLLSYTRDRHRNECRSSCTVVIKTARTKWKLKWVDNFTLNFPFKFHGTILRFSSCYVRTDGAHFAEVPLRLANAPKRYRVGVAFNNITCIYFVKLSTVSKAGVGGHKHRKHPWSRGLKIDEFLFGHSRIIKYALYTKKWPNKSYRHWRDK